MINLPITQTNLPDDFIDLGLGNPDLSLLPLDLIQQAAEKYFREGDTRSLQYGAEQGNAYFRHALVNFLTPLYGATVNPDSVFVTTGASSSLDLICTLYTQPGDTVFVEEPTYFLALRIFEDHKLRVISIPMDDDGLEVDKIEDKLADYQPKFIYTIPTFQNPSGRTLSQERRNKLVELSNQHDFLIIADEVYHFLPYNQTPPNPFAAFCADLEHVVSINSFSKILAPGLRLGSIQAHETILQKLAGCGLLDSGGGLNPFTSAIIRHLIEAGDLEKNIQHLQDEYSHRLKVLDSALRNQLPKAVYSVPQGGFFFWVQIPGVNLSQLRPTAQTNKVDFRPGNLFSSRKEWQDTMRLSFCFYGTENIKEGIRRLGKILLP